MALSDAQIAKFIDDGVVRPAAGTVYLGHPFLLQAAQRHDGSHRVSWLIGYCTHSDTTM